MSFSHDVMRKTLEKLAKFYSLPEKSFTEKGLAFAKVAVQEIEDDRQKYYEKKSMNVIKLETVQSSKDERLQEPYDLENVSYLGMSAMDVLEAVCKISEDVGQTDYLGFSIKTKRWVIGTFDRIIFYDTSPQGVLKEYAEYSYEDDENTRKHKKHYYFYDDGYNRMKKIDDGVVDIMLK